MPSPASQRPVIYQLLPRLFGNTHPTRIANGTLAENGCGKFSDLNNTSLSAIKEMGVTHLWLTGIIEHASGTHYPHRPADPPDILKGIAGSPYAIRDYFDVCPDFARNPAHRIEEFQALVARCHDHNLKVLIDFIPNHVARSYASDIRPELSFGDGDDPTIFFARDNHFYYLHPTHPGGGPPLRLPTAGQPGCTGKFADETSHGRVTGNNAITWAPSIHDWYETVKLNYGHDFTSGRNTSHLPGPECPPDLVPRTWRTMDEILAHWQKIGVDGFRVDMAHMVPIEFWEWIVRRCRNRNPHAFFAAEAYDNDPQKLTETNVLDELLRVGFDAVYDDPLYDVLEAIYDEGKWANDIDAMTFTGPRFHRSLRYAENHDEVRLANPHTWGGLGMEVGRPATAVLFTIGRGPVMLYHGQEIGEPAIGSEGFSSDNGRTSIFDYTTMPEFTKWVNHGRFDGGALHPDQRELRTWYAKLIHASQAKPFTHGEFYGLNHANQGNPHFGRVDGDPVSGHWIYAFLRHDPASGQSALVVVNFHPTHTFESLAVSIPEHAIQYLGKDGRQPWHLRDTLASDWSAQIPASELTTPGIRMPMMAPCSAMIMAID